MTLRAPPARGDQDLKMVSFRLPGDVREHLADVAKRPGQDRTRAVVEAVRLDRELEQHLGKAAERLRKKAGAMGADIGQAEGLARVLADAVLRGLDAEGL